MSYQYESSNKRWVRCECCGQKQVEWKENMTRGISRMLLKIHNACYELGEIQVHTVKDMDLTKWKLSHNEKCNLTKLRYHGLTKKVRGDDGNILSGMVELTQLGYNFLHYDVPIPKYVWSYNGKVSDAHDARATETVTFKQLAKTDVFFNSIKEFESRPHPLF
jgi:hypothetical protein